MAEASLPDIRARSKSGHRDRRDDADDRHDDQQLDEGETFDSRIFIARSPGKSDVGRMPRSVYRACASDATATTMPLLSRLPPNCKLLLTITLSRLRFCDAGCERVCLTIRVSAP